MKFSYTTKFADKALNYCEIRWQSIKLFVLPSLFVSSMSGMKFSYTTKFADKALKYCEIRWQSIKLFMLPSLLVSDVEFPEFNR